MSLVTRCPRCTTLFRVTPAQLQVRAGKVRCGRCMQVFDGFGGLGVEHGSPPGERLDVLEAIKGRDASPETAPARESAAAGSPPERTPSARPASVTTDAIAGSARERSNIRTQAALGAALLVVLVLQVVFLYRSELASRSPAAKAALTALCEHAGCTVTLPQRPDLVKIEASDVHMIDPDKPGLVQLTATLRSYANFDLAYPALDLVLTNANEHALSRRIFLPDEYLDRTRDPKRGIPPRAEITLALDLDTANLNAAGFRLDLLAAPAP